MVSQNIIAHLNEVPESEMNAICACTMSIMGQIKNSPILAKEFERRLAERKAKKGEK